MTTYKNESRHKKNKNKTRKKSIRFHQLPNLTPEHINDVSVMIFKESQEELSKDLSKDLSHLVDSLQIEGSYSPTVNRELVMLQSMSRQPVVDCNNENAFNLKEPLKIKIPSKIKISGNNCIPYYDPDAIKFLLKNLSANKHIKHFNISNADFLGIKIIKKCKINRCAYFCFLTLIVLLCYIYILIIIHETIIFTY